MSTHAEYKGARVVIMTPHEAVTLAAYAKAERDDALEHMDQLDPEDQVTTQADLNALDAVLVRVEEAAEHPREAATSRYVIPEGADEDEFLYDATGLNFPATERRLITWGSYGRSDELLRMLTDPMTPRIEDIVELWSVFRGAEEYHDGESTLQDFARWLLGNPMPPNSGTLVADEEKFEPCQVLW